MTQPDPNTPTPTTPSNPPTTSTNPPSGSPAGDPGLSPPASPPAGATPVSGQDAASATPPTIAEPPAAVERVVPAAAEYRLPDGAPPGFAEWAHKAGFTQDQLDATFAKYSEAQQATDLANLKNLQALGNAHVESWGEAKAQNVQLAKSALIQLDESGKVRQVLKQTGYINHPVVLDFLLHIGKTMSEGGFLKNAPAPPVGGKPKTAAQALYGQNHPSNA